jgi:hypothetical protein
MCCASNGVSVMVWTTYDTCEQAEVDGWRAPNAVAETVLFEVPGLVGSSPSGRRPDRPRVPSPVDEAGHDLPRPVEVGQVQRAA